MQDHFIKLTKHKIPENIRNKSLIYHHYLGFDFRIHFVFRAFPTDESTSFSERSQGPALQVRSKPIFQITTLPKTASLTQFNV